MHRIRIPRPAHATVVAYVALFVAMSGTAVAATGGSFVLGRDNTASRTSTLTSRAGAPLSLVAPPGRSPLRVDSARRVSLLNADLLDGLHGRAFARKLCHNGPADYVQGQTDCTRVLTVIVPLTNDGYWVLGKDPAPGAIAGCPFGFAVGGGYRLGESPTPDTVLASHGYNGGRYQSTSWAVRVQPAPASGGAVVPGGQVYAICVG
jgi:hypothetical protein